MKNIPIRGNPVSDQNSQLTESQIEATRKEFEAWVASEPSYTGDPHWFSRVEDGRYFYPGVRFMWRGWLAHAESIQARLELLEKVTEAARNWEKATSHKHNEGQEDARTETGNALYALDALEVGK